MNADLACGKCVLSPAATRTANRCRPVGRCAAPRRMRSDWRRRRYFDPRRFSLTGKFRSKDSAISRRCTRLIPLRGLHGPVHRYGFERLSPNYCDDTRRVDHRQSGPNVRLGEQQLTRRKSPRLSGTYRRVQSSHLRPREHRAGRSVSVLMPPPPSDRRHVTWLESQAKQANRGWWRRVGSQWCNTGL